MENLVVPLLPVKLVPVLPRAMDRYNFADEYVETLKHNMYPVLFCNPLELWTLDRRMNWDRHVHREGMPYYNHKAKQVVTFCDIVDDDVNECVKAATEEIKKRMRLHIAPELVERDFPTQRPDVKIQWDAWHYGVPEWELCIKVNVATKECQYYIADWNKRCIFWLEECPENLAPEDPSLLNTAKLGILAPASYNHMRSTLEGQFWKHVEFFPEHRDLPQGSFEELKSWFLWGITDRKTSLDSTIGYEAKDMELFLQMLTSQKWDDLQSKGYLTTVVARHWAEIWNDRSHNMFGEHTARLSRDQSRYFQSLNSNAPGFIARALACVFLFNQPYSWYPRLCETWVDKTIFLDTWRETMKEIQSESNKTGILSSIVIAANMLFLTSNPLGGPTQTSRLLSAISSIMAAGSVLSAAIISQDHAEMSRPTFTLDRAQSYLAKADKSLFGLFGASMFYSLPFAMLLWSVGAFSAAVFSLSVAKWSFLDHPLTCLITAIVFLLLSGQAIYFHCGRREYRGSSWKLPADDRDTGHITSTEPPCEKRTFETLYKHLNTSTATRSVANLVKRASTLLQRRNSRSSAPQPTTLGYADNEKTFPFCAFGALPADQQEHEKRLPSYTDTILHDEPLDLPVYEAHATDSIPAFQLSRAHTGHHIQEHQVGSLETTRMSSSPYTIEWFHLSRDESAAGILPLAGFQ